ncbi:hypothetical protein [Phytohabitans houttuyneae]|uniref:Uncharacterized protein n=1 Tax=Phytohabitans houttuyneae TaxID=1076126 RepID=A0A6V8KH91_9ACTN|nr:hypothetical protein [Phytohabitans houttuyneae]GFJ80085.1 hypothetical protein Phou_042650 [Phytohabitans houttuyneae]
MARKLSDDESAAAAVGAALFDALKRTKHGREFLRTTDPGTRGKLAWLRDLNRLGHDPNSR